MRGRSTSGVRPRVLYVAGQLGAGGAEHQLMLLLRRMRDGPIEPAVAVWEYDSTDDLVAAVRELGIPLYGTAARGSARKLEYLVRTARLIRPDYVHSTLFFTNLPSWVAATASGARQSVGSVRADYWSERRDAGRVKGPLSSWRPPDIIANSRAAAGIISQDRSLLRPSRVVVVPNAVDTDAFRPSDVPEHVSSAGRAVRLLGVGRLVPTKRWAWLIERLAEMEAKSALPPWHLRICGEGPERSSIQSAIERAKLTDRVSLLGLRSDVSVQMTNTDILVHVSTSEGTPNAVAEALSCGVPVLSTAVGDVGELMTDAVEGFLLRPDDEIGFRSRLQQLACDRNLRKAMGARGRLRMVTERGPDRLVDNTLGAYRHFGWEV